MNSGGKQFCVLGGENGSQWIFQVPVKGGRYYIITQLAVYTTYIPLIVLAFWEVM